MLAVVLDRCQIYAHRSNDATKREILRTLSYYKKSLDLEPKLRKRLGMVISVISRRPRHMLEALTRLRRSFIVPVPGIVVRFEFRRVERPAGGS